MNRAYRVRVHKPGTTNPTDATVDFTLSMPHLVDPPVLPSPIVKPAEGRTETVAWALRVLDTDNIVTSKLADPATGRAWLIGRIIDVQLSDDGGPWRTLGTARLADISEPDGPGEYTIRAEDERWLERRAPAFVKGGTTSLYPPGIRNGALWRGRPGNWDAPATIERVKVEGNFVRVRFARRHDLFGSTRSWIENDLVTRPLKRRADGEGNFRFLRLRDEWAGVDYPVITFDGLDDATFTVALGEHDKVTGGGTTPISGKPLHLWVWAPSGLPASISGRLYAPGAPPSPAVPVHTGTTAFGAMQQPHYEAKNLWDLAQVLYADAGVRVDSAAFAALPRTGVQFPVTEDLSLADWMERHAYQPEGVVPFVDSQNRIAPRLVRLPQDVDPNALFLFDASNLDAPVQWHMGRQGMITQLTFHTLATIGHAPGDQHEPVSGTLLRDWEQSGDSVLYAQHEETRHTTPASGAPVGDSLDIYLHGYEARHILAGVTTGAWDKIGVVERDIFERYADGPQSGTLHGLLSTETVQPGDLVIIDCEALQSPNAATNARTGHRIVQITQRTVYPDGYEFTFLDVGPKLQPLLVPTLAVAKDTGNPRHGVVLNVSNVPAGAAVRVELAYDAAFAQVARIVDGLAAGAHVVGELASGRTVYARPCSTAPSRIRSRWGTVRSVVLDAIPAPSALTASAVTRHTALLSWTPGDVTYGIEILLSQGGAPPQWTDDHLQATLDPGASEYRLSDLDGPSVAYTAAVRHVDRYGGRSGLATRALTTATQAATAPRPAGIAIVMGAP